MSGHPQLLVGVQIIAQIPAYSHLHRAADGVVVQGFLLCRGFFLLHGSLIPRKIEGIAFFLTAAHQEAAKQKTSEQLIHKDYSPVKDIL